MQIYSKTAGATFESFSHHLAGFRRADREPDYAGAWLAQSEKLYALVDEADFDAETGERLNQAAHLLREAAGRVGRPAMATEREHVSRAPVILPLWDAAAVAEYLARMNGSGAAVRFAMCEGAAWEGVERVVVRAERK